MEHTSKNRKKISYGSVIRVLALVFVLIATYLTFREQDWKQIWFAMRDTPTTSILYAAFVFVVSRFLQTLRFYVLCSGGLDFPRHIGLNMGAQAGIILLPFRAGELFRPLLMHKWSKDLKWTTLLFWVVFEKVLEAITLLPLLVATLVSLHWIDTGDQFEKWTFGGLLTLFVLLYPQRHRLRQWLHRISEKQNFRRAMIIPFLISSASWIAWWWFFYTLVPEALPSLVISVAVILASSIPALPAGLGAFEAAFVWSAQKYGIPASQALAMALVLHTLLIGGTLLWGIPYLVAWGIPRKESGKTL